MNKSYVIQWKSKVNGRAGRGSRQMVRDEAEQLAEELNHEYPDILHEAVPFTASTAPQGGGAEEPSESTTDETTHHTTHSFSAH